MLQLMQYGYQTDKTSIQFVIKTKMDSQTKNIFELNGEQMASSLDLNQSKKEAPEDFFSHLYFTETVC